MTTALLMNSASRTSAAIDLYLELRQAWQRDPLLYARQRLGIDPTPHQEEMLRAVAPAGARVTARSGHGTGKTSGMAMALLWFLETHDYAKAPCTAPSAHQLRDELWGEIGHLIRSSDAASLARNLPARVHLGQLFDLQSYALLDRSNAHWGAFARTARRESPDALQGFHAKHLFFCVDEASGVDDAIFERAEGSLSTAGSRLLLCGNPTILSGEFYRSHTTHAAEYTCLHFRSQDSPLVAAGYREGLVRKYGATSNVVRVRADGEFPLQESQTLIPLDVAHECYARPHRQGIGINKLGVDVGWTGDLSTFINRHGATVPHIASASNREPTEVAGQAIDYAREWEIEQIFVDIVGIGAGVYSILREECRGSKVAVFGVSASAAAPNTPEVRAMRPHRLRDYLWLSTAEWLKRELPYFAPVPGERLERQLAGELAGTRYSLNRHGELLIEDKQAMKKRVGHSPDYADGLALTFYEPSIKKVVAR